MKRFLKNTVLGAASLAALTACTSMKTPQNIEAVETGKGYQSQYREPAVARNSMGFLQSSMLNESSCLPEAGGSREAIAAKWGGPSLNGLLGEKLSRNDMVQVTIDGDDALSGTFVVSRDGTLKLPYLGAVPAQGRTAVEVERMLSNALVSAQFYKNPPRLTVRITDFASVVVGVKGAVFEPHAVEVGGIAGDALDTGRQNALGASTEGRNLAAALRAAGGVRPDADLSSVELHRAGRVYRMDLRGIFDGTDPTDIMMLSGDEIVVKSRHCFQDELMRPGPISPPGVSLFLSNLTQPATGNAVSAIGREVRQTPYGTRFMQAVVDSNCVGGSKTTNANRSAVLFSRNPITGVSVVIERDIEDLLRRGDRDDFDPYVLPGDSIACYDSTVTGIAEIGRVLGVVGTGLLLAQ
ncbi:polysaccharide biosynthesis/export family protein [uncultured Roseobacter sp.]|uniref:polysaccharide biosynthesis/export family protein n=1 Tax=uncultured Roseobacter sp. TaxID=114847 RepID=UPI002622656D|nr:polysaccharide biosynthesis/export family protein [uncultured Roseobacter sp.]